jgi:hypothetical protein
MGSMTYISFSASVVKPVIVFPTMMDFPVAGSITPGKIASPWHLNGECQLKRLYISGEKGIAGAHTQQI